MVVEEWKQGRERPGMKDLVTDLKGTCGTSPTGTLKQVPELLAPGG